MSLGRKVFHRFVAITLTALMLILLLDQHKPLDVSAAQSIVDSESPALQWLPSKYLWYKLDSPTAYNGSIRWTDTADATVSLTFTGTSISYIYTMAFNRGAVEVYIDGVNADKITDRLNGHADDMANYPSYARLSRRQTVKTYTGLSPSEHTITLKAVQGDDGVRTYIDLDAFIVNPDWAGYGTYDDTSTYITKFPENQWYPWYCSDCYNGSYRYSNTSGPGVRFTFQGDSVTWYFTKASNRGKAMVTIDGENKNWNVGYFDLYSSTTQRLQSITFNGLGDGVHTITIINIGQKNPASSGYVVDVDKIVASEGFSSYYRTLAANYADARTHDYNCYYTFVGEGCYIDDNDCMNLTSQVMRAGGFPYVPAAPPWYNWPSQWWYDAGNDVSSDTWDYVPTFMSYMTSRVDEFVRTTHVEALRKGDIVPLDLWDEDGERGHDGVADHMRVVVGAGMSSPLNEDYSGINAPNLVFDPEFDLLIDQHSPDRWQVPWDYFLIPGDVMDFIHIIKE